MDATDFIKTIKGFDQFTKEVKYDLIAYFILHVQKKPFFRPLEIVNLASVLHLERFPNYPVYVSLGCKSKRSLKPQFVKLDKGYAIERTYMLSLESSYLKRKASIQISAELHSLLASISDTVLRDYVTECINCYEFDQHRAAIVLTWCWVFYSFREWLFLKHLTSFNSETSKWKKPFTIVSVEDFQDLNEAVIIDTAKVIKVISKETHKTLKHHLDTRNSYAHPSKKPISAPISEAYIVTALKELKPLFI